MACRGFWSPCHCFRGLGVRSGCGVRAAIPACCANAVVCSARNGMVVEDFVIARVVTAAVGGRVVLRVGARKRHGTTDVITARHCCGRDMAMRSQSDLSHGATASEVLRRHVIPPACKAIRTVLRRGGICSMPVVVRHASAIAWARDWRTPRTGSRRVRFKRRGLCRPACAIRSPLTAGPSVWRRLHVPRRWPRNPAGGRNPDS